MKPAHAADARLVPIVPLKFPQAPRTVPAGIIGHLQTE